MSVAQRIQELVTVPITSLDPFAFGNPRVMENRTKEVLKTSLREFGVTAPIVVRPGKEPGRFEILDGHHRFAELRDMGEADAQVVVVDLPDDNKARALVLALGNISADWQPEQLSAYVEKLLADGATPTWVSETTGFTAAEVDALVGAGAEFLDDMANTNVPTPSDEDAEPPLPADEEHVTFTCPLTASQATVVQAAIKLVKKTMDQPSTAGALALIARRILERTDA